MLKRLVALVKAACGEEWWTVSGHGIRKIRYLFLLFFILGCLVSTALALELQDTVVSPTVSVVGSSSSIVSPSSSFLHVVVSPGVSVVVPSSSIVSPSSSFLHVVVSPGVSVVGSSSSIVSPSSSFLHVVVSPGVSVVGSSSSIVSPSSSFLHVVVSPGVSVVVPSSSIVAPSSYPPSSIVNPTTSTTNPSVSTSSPSTSTQSPSSSVVVPVVKTVTGVTNGPPSSVVVPVVKTVTGVTNGPPSSVVVPVVKTVTGVTNGPPSSVVVPVVKTVTGVTNGPPSSVVVPVVKTVTGSTNAPPSSIATPTVNVIEGTVTTIASPLVAPTVKVSPVTVDVGQSATLSVVTDVSGGTGPYSYQWMSEAPGASSYSALGSVTSSASSPSTGALSLGTWKFELVVSDATLASVTSNVVSVTVNGAFVAPTVKVSPVTVDVGQSATLSVVTDVSGGTGPYSYQWMSEAPGASSYSALGSVTSSASSPSTGALSLGTWKFELVVSDATLASVTSNVVSVTVNGAFVAPTVKVSPVTVDVGQSAMLSVVTDVSGGTGPYSYQWMSEAPGASSYSALGSVTSSASSPSTGALSLGTWKFELVVSDATLASVTSNVVSVTVNGAFVAPTVKVSPVTVDVGQSATLSVVTDVSGGTGPYSYQWMSEAPGASSYSALGSVTSSASSPSTGALSLGTWKFELVVSDATLASVTSNVVSVTVNGAFVAPTVKVSPVTVDVGQSATLSVVTDVSGGTGPYSYQWMSEAPGASSYSALGSVTSSASSPSTGALSLGTWKFELVVSDATLASVTSNVVSVTVNAAFVAPTVKVSPVTVDVGQSATLSVVTGVSGGTGPFSYQWMSEAPGASSYSALGSATSSASSPSTGALSLGTWKFELVVSDATLASVTSNVVSVTVNGAFVAPTVTVSPVTVDVGQSATLSVVTDVSGGTGPFSYQWMGEAPGG